MRTRSLLVLLCVGLSAGLNGLSASMSAANAADTTTALPMTSFRDIVVDEPHGHLFIASGGTDGIVVRDLNGGAVSTIANEPTIRDLALSPDGATLYAALRNDNAIAAIDTTTLTETARYSTGAGTCPASVAPVAGKLWFGYGCDQWTGNLGVIDPAAQQPNAMLGLLASDLASAPELASTPAKPGMVVLADVGTNPGLIQVYDVSSGSAVAGVKRTNDYVGSGWSVTPDGTRLLTSAGESLLLSDLSSEGVFNTGSNYNPMGFVASATGLVAGSVLGWYTDDVVMFRADRATIRSYDTGGCCSPGQSGSVPVRGMAFNAAATVLYAITTDYLGNAVQLRIFHDPGKSPSAIALTKPTAATINHVFSITGKLTSSIPIPAGKVLSIQRDSTYGTVPLPSRTTGPAGSFTITDTITKRGAYGYRATWAGDADHVGATTRITFRVTGLATSVSITTGAGPYRYGARPLVVAHLGTTKVRTLSLYVQPYGGTKVLLKKGTVDSHGNLSVYYTMYRRTTFTASFVGDETYEPRYAAKAFTSYAKLNSVLFGSYGRSGSYHLYRTSVDPGLLVSVAPNNAGSCVSFTAQRYDSGAWHTIDSLSCERIDGNSRAGATLYTNAPAGTRYRMRGNFKGNLMNAGTYGTWQYIKFTT